MLRIFILICLQIFILVYYHNAPTTLDRVSISILLFLVVISLSLLFLRKEKDSLLKGQYLKHSTLVLVGYCAVHFQYFVDFLAGYIPIFNPYIWVNTEVVVKALTVSVSGLIAFILGYLLRTKAKTNSQPKNHDKNEFCGITILLYSTTALLILYFYFVNPLYLMGYYGVERVGETAAYIILLFRAMIFAIIIQNARNFVAEDRSFPNFLFFMKAHGLHFNIILGVYLLSVMISGDRGPLMIFAIVYYSSFLFVSKYKLSAIRTVGLLLVGALFISLLGKVRNQDRTKSFSERIESSFDMESRFKTESVLPQTQELATSVRILHHTMNYVPDKHDYLLGRFQLQQTLSIIPYGNSIITAIYGDNHWKYGASSRFVTWLNQGENPYSGDGSSVTADFYFDFGILGVIAGMFIFGYYMRAAEMTMYTSVMPSLFAHSFFIVYIGSAIYISRATFLIQLKAVVWVWFILWFNKKIINKK